MSAEQNLGSPCSGVCTIGGHGYCKGCFRTINEIEHWHEMPRAARQLAKKYAKKRRKVFGALDAPV